MIGELAAQLLCVGLVAIIVIGVMWLLDGDEIDEDFWWG